MKTRFILLFVLLSVLSAKAQYVTIPDTAFVNWLRLTGLQNCINGNQLDTTCQNVINANQLSIFGDDITNLEGIQYFRNILSLDASCYNLVSMPALPVKVKTFLLDGGKLSSLPPLPSGLRKISLSYITTSFNLPDNLPASLRELELISNDSLFALPLLPDSLTVLDCGVIPITVLPVLPNSIRKLYVRNCYITSIPQLPRVMDVIDCHECRINSIANFPDSVLQFCGFVDNPDLKCIPPIGFMQYFGFTGTDVSCLPNYGNVLSSSPALDTFSICNLFNIYDCKRVENVAGKLFLDLNENCSVNFEDMAISNAKCTLWSQGIMLQQTYTDNDGYFSFDVDNLGAYEIRIDTTDLPFTLLCPASAVYYDTITATDSLFYNNHFAFKCSSGFDLVALGTVTQTAFRPANNTLLGISLADASDTYSAYCSPLTSGTVTVTISGPVTYVAPHVGSLPPSSVADSVITWNITSLETINLIDDIKIILRTDTFAQIGQQVCIRVSIAPVANDINPGNNTLAQCFDIVNSYDPNDKQVSPPNNIDTLQEWLIYTVRFQNTGNAEAQHIYITDTLDSDIDAASFKLLTYSHQPNVQINNNVVRFNFPNINLPDSLSNEPGSHGYIQYKIKLKENLPVGTQVDNTAYIYFDFNEPIITNTTTNTITEIKDTSIVGIKPVGDGYSLSIFPNPANQTISISVSEPANNFTIINAHGSVVIKQAMNNNIEKLNIADLPSGVYYIEVNSIKGAARKKLIKL